MRGFLNSEIVLDLKPDNEFKSYIGYVIQGRILLLDEKDKPLGLVMKDEFFLGRPFSISDLTVKKLLSADDQTLIVFIPKEVVNALASASPQLATIIEDIYDSVFERARLIANDSASPKTIQEWVKSQDMSKTLSSWVETLEKKRRQSIERKRRELRDQNILAFAWGMGLVGLVVVMVESLARRGNVYFSFSQLIDPSIVFEPFKAGSRFNIIVGIIGVTMIGLTLLHALLIAGVKKFKWKINYKLSSDFHMYFGIMGACFVLFHSAFHLNGMNVANFAFYTMVIGVSSGIIGQFISNQIPKTIRGEKVKLEGLKEEQKKLQQKAELLIDNQGMYKTSVALISTGLPASFWGHVFSGPLLWWRARRVRSALKGLGLSGKSAGVAAHLILKEYELRQKVRLLEISNTFFKKWMIVHRPIGYLVYVLATIHVLLVTIFA